LFLYAKPQNGPLMLPLAVFVYSFNPLRARWISALVVIAAGLASIGSSSTELRKTNTYNVLFSTILGESKHPQQDLEALGLDPDLVRYKDTARWSPDNGFDDLVAKGVIGSRVTLA